MAKIIKQKDESSGSTLYPITSTDAVYNSSGTNLSTIISNIESTYAKKTDATQSASGLMSASDKKKLDGISSGANAYSHPTSSGNKHIPSGGSSGQILRWSADGTATWGSDNNTTYSDATTSASGLMSASDKTKLNGIASGANAYSHPTYTAKSSGLYKVTVDGTGHVSATAAVAKADITGLGIPAQDTTYSAATTSANGLMTSAMVTKLNGIATGATANTGTITAVQANGTSVATSGTANIPAASTSAYGVTKLIDSVSSTSTVLAATANAVKTAYDLANSANSTASSASTTASNAMPKSGGTFTGPAYAQANTSYTTYQLRNIALSTSASTPTGNGSILGVYS